MTDDDPKIYSVKCWECEVPFEPDPGCGEDARCPICGCESSVWPMSDELKARWRLRSLERLFDAPAAERSHGQTT